MSGNNNKRKRSNEEETGVNEKKVEENDGAEFGSGRVPMVEIRSGHLLSRTEYMRVLEVMPNENKMRVEVLRGDKPNDLWDITTNDALLASSAEYAHKEEKISKTELANKLVHCKDDVFKVVFRPVLTQELLATRLKEVVNELAKAKTDAAYKKVAKQLLEVPEKTLRARLISPNTVLGYSLVDDLEQTDPQKVQFRNVSHSNILSLTLKGTRFVLK